MIYGRHRDGYYEPEPSVQRFECFLGAIISAIPCAACRNPLGEGPMIQVDHRKYHPDCYRRIENREVPK